MEERFALKDFPCVHNLLLQITEGLLGEKVPLPAAIEPFRQSTPPPEAAAVASGWLWLLDASIGPHHFRSWIQRLDPPDEELQALVRYLARKRPLQEVDLERLEWLVTHMFRNASRLGRQTSTTAMLQEITRWLEAPHTSISGTPDVLLTELIEILEGMVACSTLRELTQSGLIDHGRKVKQRFKEEFVHPQVLAAVVNYNLVSGRKFEQLLSEALTESAGAEIPTDVRTKEYRSAAQDLKKWTEITAPPPTAQELARTISRLEIDAEEEEGKLRSRINELASFARAASKPVLDFPLAHSNLTLTPWEVQSLAVEYPGGEKSFRAELNRALRRAIGLLASIQEETALYDVNRNSQYLWERHVDALIYLLYKGEQNLEDLGKLAQDALARGLKDRAEQVSQTAAQLRQSLDGVTELYQEWRRQSDRLEH